MPTKPLKTKPAKSSKPVTRSPSAVKRPPENSAVGKAAKRKPTGGIGSGQSQTVKKTRGLTPPGSPKTKTKTPAETPIQESSTAKRPAKKQLPKSVPESSENSAIASGRPTKGIQKSSAANQCEPPAHLPFDGDYEQHKVRANNRQRLQSEDKREIGPIPAPENPQRRASCERNFDKFLKTYFPEDTRHPWSKVHMKLIETIQIVVLVGAMLAMGIPRGWGKTFISVRAILWAVCYRHHTMCMLIAASDPAAKDLIQDIRDEIETNELLQADFPEICLPIAALEGINQRGKGQTSCGVATKVKAADFELHLGDINGQPGAVIYAGGITGSKIRGRRKKRGDKIERPTLGLIDDFQTRQSARSRMQCQTRLNIVSDDIPGLPGNDQAWSCLLTCTVIEPGDAADQLLDRKQHPDWRGIRASFLDSLPNDDAIDLWEEWNRIRVEDLQTFDHDEDDIEQEAISERAHAFYRKHHKAMNAGCVVAWKWAYKPEHYVDALEKAMHWYFRSRRGFWSELQNQPDKYEVAKLPQLIAHTLQTRTHHLTAHMAPDDAEFITAHADYSAAVLWYEVRAWAQNSTSWTIDYGTWPGQGKAYFTQATAQHTIDKMYAHLPTHAVRVMAAIRDLFIGLFETQFQREDGTVLRLNIGGIDANDETDTIRDAIKKAGLTGKLWPMHSRSFRFPKTPLNDLPVKDGDVCGDNWRRRKPSTGNLRYITYDTDHWKSHHRNRLIMDRAAPGALTWFKGSDHRMLADHHVAEYSETLVNEVTNQRSEIWGLKPGADNHLWDVGCGNDVLGSVLGCRLPASMMLSGSTTRVESKKRKRRKTRIAV